VTYVSAIGLTFVLPILSAALFVLMEVMWLVPDRRIESKITGPQGEP
jgi:hypothetical protein